MAIPPINVDFKASYTTAFLQSASEEDAALGTLIYAQLQAINGMPYSAFMKRFIGTPTSAFVNKGKNHFFFRFQILQYDKNSVFISVFLNMQSSELIPQKLHWQKVV